MVVWYSLHEWNVLANTFTFEGAGNYERMLEDPGLRNSLVVSGWFSLGLVVLNISLAMVLALLLNQKLRGTTAFRVMFFSPVVVSLVAWTIVWGFLLQADGGINGFLSTLGIEGPNWLRNGTTAMISVIVVQVFKNVGLNMILFLAALQGVPVEIQEAAQLDGANAWRRFWAVIVPLVSPTILLVSIITVVGSLEVFAQIDVLTQGGPGHSTTVLVYYLYQQAFEFNQFGYASAVSVLLFVLVHKIGDTLANLTFRLLFEDLGFTNDEIAFYDVSLGFFAFLIGIFVGGIVYSRLGMKKAVMLSLILMAVSNLSFAGLAAAGHSNWGMAGAIGFENFASGVGGVAVVAYLSALCNLQFTGTQFALLSAAASILGRFLTGTTAGSLIEAMGYVNFYLLTTLAAFPGVIMFWLMIRYGLVDRSLGTAGSVHTGDKEAGTPSG